MYEFQNGTTDILCQLTLTPERRDKWNMVGPIRNNNRAYYVKIDSKINDVTALNDLKGLIVVTIMGYHIPYL